MSCPRCVDSVGIRILWLRSSYWHSRQANDAVASERSIFSKQNTIIIYKTVFRAAVNTYVSLPIFRGLDARGGKNYEQAHTHAGQPQYSNDNNNYYKLFEALKLIRIIYTVLMQNRSCFTRKQTHSLKGLRLPHSKFTV